MLRVLMLAPPGAGKGTQAKRIAARFEIEHIASGELFRREIAAGTEIGQLSSDYLSRGDLVPDDVVIKVVLPKLVAAAQAGGYVLDGFPRNVHQAEMAYEVASSHDDVTLQAVLHLRVGRDELRRRMLARARSEGRGDDTAATIEHRLEVYDRQTQPLLEYYHARGLVFDVDGERDPDQVTREILELLEEVKASV